MNKQTNKQMNYWLENPEGHYLIPYMVSGLCINTQ